MADVYTASGQLYIPHGSQNIKENNTLAIANLNNCPTTPRKMRIVAESLNICISLLQKLQLNLLKLWGLVQLRRLDKCSKPSKLES